MFDIASFRDRELSLFPVECLLINIHARSIFPLVPGQDVPSPLPPGSRTHVFILVKHHVDCSINPFFQLVSHLALLPSQTKTRLGHSLVVFYLFIID